MSDPSGPHWCDLFPCSKLTTNLVEPFHACADHYIDALESAGAIVTISTTFRPPERAYLMHYAWLIAKGRMLPREVPPMDGVDIDWTHEGHTAEAVQAAKAMVETYGIDPDMPYPPSLQSRHTKGRAIDMKIRWKGIIHVRDNYGILHACAKQEDLWAIGASYGVHKLATDAPHWSDDGH